MKGDSYGDKIRIDHSHTLFTIQYGFKVSLYTFDQTTYINVNASLSFGVVAFLFLVVFAFECCILFYLMFSTIKDHE